MDDGSDRALAGGSAMVGGVDFSADLAREHSRFIFEQDMNSRGLRLPKLPWETGVMGVVFGNAELHELPKIPPVLLPTVGGLIEEEKDEGKEFDDDPLPPGVLPVYARNIKALTDRDFEASQALVWTRALARWLAIVESGSFQSSVGVFVEECLQRQDREGALQCIRDACGIRSPSTVLKRAQDLGAFILWCDNDGWWPLEEKDLINYLGYCQGKGRSKLVGKNLKHALKFFRFVIGAHFDLDDVVGPVFSGKASRIAATKEAKVQARPLTVKEVEALEEVVTDGRNLLDRYFAGCLLYCLYSRARWSDIGNIDKIEWDVVEVHGTVFGFIESRTRVTKTSTTEEKKTLWMPFVAPVCGVRDPSWGMAWRDVLLKLNINLDSQPFGPLCRAPSSDGSFSRRTVTSVEASGLLRDFLETKEDKVSSHSLKATTLAWSARYGLSDRSRAILGHHALKDQSMACYSRDLMTGPTRELCALLLNVKNKNFMPDSTRSGWLASHLDRLFVPAAAGATPGARTPVAMPKTPWYRPDDADMIFEEGLPGLPPSPSVGAPCPGGSVLSSGFDREWEEVGMQTPSPCDFHLGEEEEPPAAQPDRSVESLEQLEFDLMEETQRYETAPAAEDEDIAKLKIFMEGKLARRGRREDWRRRIRRRRLC